MRKKTLIPFSILLLVVGCSPKVIPVNGTVRVQLIQPQSTTCAFRVEPVDIKTLSYLSPLQGKLGKLVQTGENIGAQTTLNSLGSNQLVLNPVVLNFHNAGGTYLPADYGTLLGVSFYAAMERAHNLFSGLYSNANMISKDSTLSQTPIIQDAVYIEDGETETDNASYFATSFDGWTSIVDMFLTYPLQSISAMPLGINPGVVVHEYSHSVTMNLYRREVFSKGPTNRTQNHIRALDEGIADYFGYLGTGNPKFLLCSFPDAAVRDMTVLKKLNSDLNNKLNNSVPSEFAPHTTGAIIAALFYKIGESIGNHDANAKAILQAIETSKTYGDFSISLFKSNHLNRLGGYSSKAEEVYDYVFGSYIQ